MPMLDRLLRYAGLNGFDGLTHIRAYEQPDGSLIVIAGELSDNPGTSVTNAIEAVGEAVAREVAQGKTFRLIEHYPERGKPGTFDEVTFTGEGGGPPAGVFGVEPDGTQRTIRQDRPAAAAFTGPHWKRIDRAALESLVGEPIEEWEPDAYTASGVAGTSGAQQHTEQKADVDRRHGDLNAIFREFEG